MNAEFHSNGPHQMKIGGARPFFIAAFLLIGLNTWGADGPAAASTSSSEVLKGLKAPVSSERPWQPPDLAGFAGVLKATAEREADSQKDCGLAELIDLAERTHPETKIAWEHAKQAASAVGLAQSEYFPLLALRASADYAREPFPLPLTPTRAGYMDLSRVEIMPEGNLVPTKPDLRIVGRRIGLGIILAFVVVAIVAVWSHDNRPQTDDSTLRANFIGVAPQASRHIVELHVKDNQYVKEGDLLFVIDPRPYKLAVARAKAILSLTHKEVAVLEKALKVADASIVRAEAQRLAAEASVERTEAEFTEAEHHVKRLEPLLAKEFATADQLEAARTRRLVAETSVREAQRLLAAATAALEQAKVERLRADDAIGQEGGVNARIAAAKAQLHEAELNLEYCRVTAPFSGKVVNFKQPLPLVRRSVRAGST